jgi:hypothetical protein
MVTEMERSNCCHKPIYIDVLDTGERIGRSKCVKIIYRCSGCNKQAGVVSWADAGTTGHDDKGKGDPPSSD